MSHQWPPSTASFYRPPVRGAYREGILSPPGLGVANLSGSKDLDEEDLRRRQISRRKVARNALSINQRAGCWGMGYQPAPTI